MMARAVLCSVAVGGLLALNYKLGAMFATSYPDAYANSIIPDLLPSHRNEHKVKLPSLGSSYESELMQLVQLREELARMREKLQTIHQEICRMEQRDTRKIDTKRFSPQDRVN